MILCQNFALQIYERDLWEPVVVNFEAEEINL